MCEGLHACLLFVCEYCERVKCCSSSRFQVFFCWNFSVVFLSKYPPHLFHKHSTSLVHIINVLFIPMAFNVYVIIRHLCVTVLYQTETHGVTSAVEWTYGSQLEATIIQIIGQVYCCH